MAYKEQIAKERAKIYYEDLRQYSPEQIGMAFDECRRTLDFFPRISQILRVINPPPKEIDPGYWPSFDRLGIEHKEEPFGREEAKTFLGEIQNHIEEKDRKEAEERQLKFEDRKKELEEQRKKIVEGLN